MADTSLERTSTDLKRMKLGRSVNFQKYARNHSPLGLDHSALVTYRHATKRTNLAGLESYSLADEIRNIHSNARQLVAKELWNEAAAELLKAKSLTAKLKQQESSYENAAKLELVAADQLLKIVSTFTADLRQTSLVPNEIAALILSQQITAQRSALKKAENIYDIRIEKVMASNANAVAPPQIIAKQFIHSLNSENSTNEGGDIT